MQTALEDSNIEVISTKFERLPTSTKALDYAQDETVFKLIELMEEDDDVMNVYHNVD